MSEVESKLNMEAIETFASDSIEDMKADSATHVSKGDTKWGTLKASHDERFLVLDGKAVELNE